MIRLLPLIILSNTINGSNGYAYKSDIEVACEVPLISTKNSEGEDLQVNAEIRLEGYMDYNSTYDKEIHITNYYANAYYYVDSDLVTTYGGSTVTQFYFTNFILGVDVDISYDGYISLSISDNAYVSIEFAQSYFNNYIYDKSDLEGRSISFDCYIDEGVGAFFSEYLGSLMAKEIGQYQDFNDGYQYGYDKGSQEGYRDGYTNGDSIGYARGYNDGFNEGFNADSTAVTIFTGILSIGMLPINFFLAVFNFEILGINMTNFVSAILSLAIVIIVIRVILGHKGEGGS